MASEKKTGCGRGEAARQSAGYEQVGSSATLYRLLAWLSPAFPIGAFSYSSGLEWAVEAGDVKDMESLQGWITTIVGDGGGFCDAVFFVHAHRALNTGNFHLLRDICALSAAFAPSKERHLETTAQGRAFVATASAAWPCLALDRLVATWSGPITYPVAVAVISAGHDIALKPALLAFLHAITANLVSAGVRLLPLGQTDGQRVLAALEDVVLDTAMRASATRLEDVGGAAFRVDLASMRHEDQYTRLFRS